MKKTLTLLLLATLLVPHAAAQNNYSGETPAYTSNTPRKYSFGLQLVQHAGLNRWSSETYVNRGLPAPLITELRGMLNISFNRYTGMFMDMGMGLMPAPRMKTLDMNLMPVPYTGTQYYLRDTWSSYDNGNATGVRFKMTAGLFGNIPTNHPNLTIMPFLGIGFMTMPQIRYEVTLKEHGSNMEYRTTYIFNSKYEGGQNLQQQSSPGYITGRLNFRYNTPGMSHILFGLEYTRLINTIDFYGKHTNTFNANIGKEYSTTGNKVNLLGISIGMSF